MIELKDNVTKIYDQKKALDNLKRNDQGRRDFRLLGPQWRRKIHHDQELSEYH